MEAIELLHQVERLASKTFIFEFKKNLFKTRNEKNTYLIDIFTTNGNI